MADPVVQVPAQENLPAAQAAAVLQPPPPPPPPQNAEEPLQNAAGEQVTLEVCSIFLFVLLQYRTRVLALRIPVTALACFQLKSCPALNVQLCSFAGNFLFTP